MSAKFELAARLELQDRDEVSRVKKSFVLAEFIRREFTGVCPLGQFIDLVLYLEIDSKIRDAACGSSSRQRPSGSKRESRFVARALMLITLTWLEPARLVGSTWGLETND